MYFSKLFGNGCEWIV